MTLFRQYFRAQRAGLLIWVGSNGVLAWVLASTSKPMELGGTLGSFMSKLADKFPPGLRGMFGLVPGLSPIDSLIQAKIGIWLAIILPVYACILAASAVSREVDRGTAGFLLALPVRRRDILIARWAVMAANLGLIAFSTWGALYVGLKMSSAVANFTGYFWMTAQAWFLGLAAGSLAMLGSMWAREYDGALRWALASVGVLFTVDLGMRVAEMPKLARFFNPFTYFDSLQPLLRKSLVWGDAAVLLGASLVSLWLAVRVFESKQIEA